MDINVRIEAPALVDAVNSLATAIAGNMELLLNRPEVPAGVITPAIPPTLPAAPDTKETETNASAAPSTDDTPDNKAVFTVVDLRAKANEVGSTPEKKQAIKALLNKYESKSLSGLPEEYRAAFMAELEAL